MNFEINITQEGTVAFPLHAHSTYELLYYLEGEGSLVTEIGDYSFSQGIMMVVPPNLRHGSVSPKGFKNISVSGDFSYLLSEGVPIAAKDNAQKDGQLLAELIYRNRYGDKQYLTDLSNAFIRFFLNQASVNDKIHEVLNKIHEEIRENAFNPQISLSSILQSSGYAEDYIRMRFTKAYGMPPLKFLTKLRIEHACSMLKIYKDQISLAEIAEKCGYTDYVYFSKTFRAYTGKSPRAYIKSLPE